jgi:hypothetical protein
MSILKGFISLFDWMLPPKTYQDLSDDLDSKMQDLYEKQGWGEYVNPLKNSTGQELDNFLNKLKPENLPQDKE